MEWADSKAPGDTQAEILEEAKVKTLFNRICDMQAEEQLTRVSYSELRCVFVSANLYVCLSNLASASARVSVKLCISVLALYRFVSKVLLAIASGSVFGSVFSRAEVSFGLRPL